MPLLPARVRRPNVVAAGRPPPAKKPADPGTHSATRPTETRAPGKIQGQRRYRQQQKPKMTLMAGLVCGVVVAAVMGLTFAKKALPEKRGGGIDMTQVVIAGIAGGILAGGVALVRVLMTKGTEDTEERGRQKYRRQ